MDRRRVWSAVAKYGMNPVARHVAGRVPGWALLETTGRRTGRPIRNPVGDGLVGDTFWIVAEHGRRADYVRNLERHPRVRVKVRGRWRTGSAEVLEDDDPRQRLRWLARRAPLSRVNGVVVRAMGSDLLTVRVALDPHEDGPFDAYHEAP